MQFREDINGLRAVAVIAVVLFHFSPTWVPGGFAGVDVFFVISGFLMTGIIFRGIEQKSFSIIKFYIDRGNRIIPPLVILCVVLLIFGWLFLIPIDYERLGKHVVSSIGFLSNVIYWRESGYFSVDSHEKWLLHTWSLSVEWQFYMIYPLVLVAMRKIISMRMVKVSVLVGAIIGFAFCVVATLKWPNLAYYLLPTRAWEMLLGAVAYLYPVSMRKNEGRVLEWSGLVLIVGSCFLITKNSPWPGYLAFFPVAGTYLVIQARRNNSYFTGNIVFQKLGAWSYSIYLWHWPIVVAIYCFSLNKLFVFSGVAASIFLGWLSYKYVEKVRYSREYFPHSEIWRYAPSALVLCVALVGFLAFYKSGFLFRFSEDVQQKNNSAVSAISDWNYPSPNLKVGDKDVRFVKGGSEKNILFIGGSHVEQTYPYVKNLGSDYNVYYLTKGGCFVTQSFRHPKWSCSNIQDYKSVMEKVKFDKVVTSLYLLDTYLPEDEQIKGNQLQLRLSEYDDFLRYAKNNSNEVIVILGEPKGLEFDPVASVRNDLNSFVDVDEVRRHYSVHYLALELLSELEGVSVIDPINYLCSDVCSVMDEDFKYYYKDQDHMRPWYAKKALTYLESIFSS